MDELPQLFQDIEFHVVWKGYDSDEVDAYVDRVAKAAALVHGRVSELQQRAEAAEARAATGGGSLASSETEETLTRTLILAQRTADAAIAEAKAEAAQLIASAEGQGQIALSEARSSAAAVTKDADDHASRVKAEAETDRRSLLANAEVEAAAAASSEHERLANEVSELEQYRAFLVDDVDLLERHLREQRSVLAASVSALSDLVERPDAFRVDQAPETSGVVPPAAARIDVTAAEEVAAGLDAAELAEEIEVEPMPVVAEPELEPEAQLEPEPEPEPEPESVHEPAVEMPPIVAVDGDVEFVDVTPTALPVVEESTPEPIEFADEREFADDEELWTAPVAAWDDPSFASESTQPAKTAEPVSNLIDLTAPEEPLHPVFDPRDLPTLDAPSGLTEAATAQLESPAPPLLVTAADFEPFSEDDTQSGELIVDEPTAPIPMLEDTLFAERVEESSDPFLDQLRDAVAFDDVELGDDALAAFFDHDEGAAGRGWFGRKR